MFQKTKQKKKKKRNGMHSFGMCADMSVQLAQVNGTKAAFKIIASATPVSKLSTLYMSRSDHNCNDDSFLIFGYDVGVWRACSLSWPFGSLQERSELSIYRLTNQNAPWIGFTCSTWPRLCRSPLSLSENEEASLGASHFLIHSLSDNRTNTN